MKGRKRIPDEMKAVKGTLQKCRARKSVKGDLVKADSITSEGVQGLNTERSREIYVMKCRQLAALELLEETYQEQMVIYAYWLDKALVAMDALDREGLFKNQYNDNGQIIGFLANPHIKFLETAVKIVNEIGGRFGFSPISRQNIRFKEKEINPAADLDNLVG